MNCRVFRLMTFVLISFYTKPIFAQLITDSAQSSISHRFYLGTHLLRFPMPEMDELKADMDNLKKHGFNLIKIQTHWGIDEPVEGRYDFEKYEKVIKYADQLGMKVYLGLTLEQAPAWLYTNYPDVRMVGKNGVTIAYDAAYTLPSDGKPGPCYDSPVAKEKQLRYIHAIITALSKYKNIAFWETWQEIAYWSEASTGQPVCYCHNTLAHFREYLAGKYKTITALNQSWKTNFGGWELVEPNRGPTIGSGQDIDWKFFIDNTYITDILKARYKAVKENDPLKRTVFAHLPGPSLGSGRDWNYAHCQDFLGSSSYPAWGPFSSWDDVAPERSPLERYTTQLTEMWNSLALNFDYLRSANPPGNPIWAAEFQGGPISSDFRKGRVPSANDMRRWMLTVIGSGCTSICFWVTRAEIMAAENNGFNLLNSEGNTTERYEEASRIGTSLISYPDLFGQSTKPLAHVGIIVDEANCDFTSSYFNTNQHLTYSTRGWYKMFWDLGIPVDFVDMHNVNENSALQYRALILPFPISLADTNAAKLEKYILSGGNLITEAAIGRITDNGMCPRGELSPRMRKLLSVDQTSFTMIKEPNNGKRWMGQERGWGEMLEPASLQGTGILQGQAINANFYLETFHPLDSKPILMYKDKVAGTVRNVGKGNAWILGSFIGHNGTAYGSSGALRFVEALMNNCGVHRENVGKLLVRKRVGINREAWLFTNPTQMPVTEQIDVKGWNKVTNLFGGVQTVVNHKATLNVKSLDVEVFVLEH